MLSIKEIFVKLMSMLGAFDKKAQFTIFLLLVIVGFEFKYLNDQITKCKEDNNSINAACELRAKLLNEKLEAKEKEINGILKDYSSKFENMYNDVNRSIKQIKKESNVN